MSTPAPVSGGAARSSLLQLAIKEKAALYAAYIPFFKDGGLFVPTARDFRLGEDLYLMVTLLDDPQRYPISGKVAWITPARAVGGGSRTQGVGIAFPADEKSQQLKMRIEQLLGGLLASDRPTQTI